ncbi:MAG: hypothetical protein KUF72_15080 [Candidatus Thiodiazotropha sp. (ex Ctena orbiculata)]|nr:hypothetical protein [Candidatus Thiodiazotropha taylori]
MRGFFSLLFLLFISLVAPADWIIEKNSNSSPTNTLDEMAIVKNGLGDSFSLYRISDSGEVWANFTISKDFTDPADWNTPPMLRIDSNKPISLSRQKDLQVMGVAVDAYKWRQDQLEFLIWHGKESEGLSDTMVQIMEGKELVVRYYLSRGRYRESSFPLTEAKTTITSALAIKNNTSHSTQQTKTTFKEYVLLEIKQCLQQAESSNSCLRRIKECRNKADQEIGQFNRCYR